MKVLHAFKQYYPYHKGGIEHVIDRLSIFGIERGVNVQVVTLGSRHKYPVSYNYNGITVTELPEIKSLKSLKIGGLRALLSYVKLVSEFDFVIFHAPWPFINILALFTPKKVKKVLFYHSDLIGKGILGYIYNKLLLRPVLSQFELIIFTSEKYRAGSVVAKVMDTKIRIIPLGIPKVKIFDLPLASILNPAEEFVLFLGSLREYKGLKYLLDSASCDGSILYVIAGSGVCKNDLLRIKEEKNLNNLLFLEDVGEELKASLLMNCSLLVLPSISRAEAFGLVILEAMAYGKPVITTEIGTATSEINIHGITGLVVPPMNSIALYHAIRCLMNKPRLRTRLGRAGKKRVECYYSEQLMFESFHGALLQLSNYEKC